MPNIPLNQYSREKTPLGATEGGQKVFISKEYWTLIDLIIKRLGGGSAFSVADLQALGSFDEPGVISEVNRIAQDLRILDSERTFPEVEKRLQDALILAILGGGNNESGSFDADDVEGAGRWEPVSNADTSTPDILYDAATADVCVTFVS